MNGIQIVIIVLAFNRPGELLRTLGLLNQLSFLEKYTLPLTISIDGPADGAGVDETRRVAEEFKWRGGAKTVKQHKESKGIVGQWTEAWKPKSNSEFALIVEDDVSISPLALPYFYLLIPKHRADPTIFGIALQRPQWQMGICERGRWRRLDLVDACQAPPLYRYPAVGTWGQLLFPGPWRSFLQYYANSDDDSLHNGMITEKWDERGRRLFSPVFTRWALERGMYNLYANWGNSTAMATSRQPPGVNSLGHCPYDDRFPNELQVVDFICSDHAVRTMSACFDPIDLSEEDHLEIYGLVITSKIDCHYWSANRIYPLRASNALPRLEIRACFVEDPLTWLNMTDSAYTFNGQEVMRVIINDDKDSQQIPLTNLTFDGEPRYYCPFRVGLYPDRIKYKL